MFAVEVVLIKNEVLKMSYHMKIGNHRNMIDSKVPLPQM